MFLSRDRIDSGKVLNKFRESLEPAMAKLGHSFASTGLSANFWTGLGLAIGMASGVVYASHRFGHVDVFTASLAGGILLLASGFLDIVDGAVARVTKKSSAKGAFLDSSFDKITEVVIFVGIAVGRLADPSTCAVALGLSLLVSYSRARAESLGVQLKGIGIGERAERIMIIAVSSIIPVSLSQGLSSPSLLQWGVIAVAVVAGITLAQRIIATAKKLST